MSCCLIIRVIGVQTAEGMTTVIAESVLAEEMDKDIHLVDIAIECCIRFLSQVWLILICISYLSLLELISPILRSRSSIAFPNKSRHTIELHQQPWSGQEPLYSIGCPLLQQQQYLRVLYDNNHKSNFYLSYSCPNIRSYLHNTRWYYTDSDSNLLYSISI